MNLARLSNPSRRAAVFTRPHRATLDAVLWDVATDGHVLALRRSARGDDLDEFPAASYVVLAELARPITPGYDRPVALAALRDWAGEPTWNNVCPRCAGEGLDPYSEIETRGDRACWLCEGKGRTADAQDARPALVRGHVFSREYVARALAAVAPEEAVVRLSVRHLSGLGGEGYLLCLDSPTDLWRVRLTERRRIADESPEPEWDFYLDAEPPVDLDLCRRALEAVVDFQHAGGQPHGAGTLEVLACRMFDLAGAALGYLRLEETDDATTDDDETPAADA